VAHAHGAAGSFANHREGLCRQRAELGTGREPVTEFLGLGPQLRIAQGLQRAFEGTGLANQAVITADQPVVAAAEHTGQELEH
jgi:hypothetical protein